MPTRLRLLLVLGLQVLIVCLLVSQTAFAENPKDGFYSSPFGYSPDGNYLTGCYAKFDGEAPEVNSQGCSGAWIMLENAYDGTQYMQVGYMRDRKYGPYPEDTRPRWFMAWNNDDGLGQTVHWYGLISSGRYMYQITSDSTNYYFLINGTTKVSLPKTSIHWYTDTVMMADETRGYSNDYWCGGSSVHNSFGSCTYRDSNSNSSPLNPSSTYSLKMGANDAQTAPVESGGITSFNLWDTRVADMHY